MRLAVVRPARRLLSPGYRLRCAAGAPLGPAWNAAASTARAANAAPPPHVAAARRLSSRPASYDGVVIDPRRVEDFAGDAPSLFSAEGLSRKYRELQEAWKSSVAAAFITKHVPSFKVQTFPPTAAEAFSDFLAAFRARDEHKLRRVVTPAMLRSLRKQMGGPKAKRWVAMEQDGEVGPVYVVQMRHAYTKPMVAGIGQVMVLIHSRRRIVPLDGKGNVVTQAKDPTAPAIRTIEDPCLAVMEVDLEDRYGQWKIAAIVEAAGTPRGAEG